MSKVARPSESMTMDNTAPWMCQWFGQLHTMLCSGRKNHSAFSAKQSQPQLKMEIDRWADLKPPG